MKKIISLFQRNYDSDKLVRDEIVPGAEWVTAGEGIATVKHDGTCCLIRDGRIFKRYDVKQGKTPPQGFEPAQDPDPKTGHWPGWLPVGDGPEDKWHAEAFRALGEAPDGTYELCGPKVNGNAEGLTEHKLIPHGQIELLTFPRTFEEIKAAFRDHLTNIEGIVWHHPDGRMVKIKAKDFGFKRRQP